MWCNHLSNSAKKTQNKGYYGVQGHSRSSRSVSIESPYAILLVINSNWHPISYRFEVIAAYCSNFGHFAFSSHPLGGLGATFDVHLGLIGKRGGLPISVNWTFLLVVTAESLRAKRDRKSAISLERGHFDPKFLVEKVAPHQSFLYG